MKRFIVCIITLIIALSSLTEFVPLRASALSANEVPNPSFETPSTSNSALPNGWQMGGWGTNTASFSYATTAHTGTRSGSVKITSYSSGDAKWYFTPQPVTPGAAYTYSDYYTSTVPTSLVAQFDNGKGSYTYVTLQDNNVATSSSWAQSNTTFTAPAGVANVTIFHLINSVGSLDIDDASLSAVTLSAPTVSVTNPIASSTLGGTVQLTASASDANGISSVQFQIDGKNEYVPVTSPYSVNWDTTTVSDGVHTITAVATNSQGVTTTSAPVSVTVKNTVVVTPPTTNLVPNPSVETPNSTTPTQPQSWQTGGWGTNTTTFSYPQTGAEDGTHSLTVKTTKYTSGDSKWYFTPVAVVAGTTYSFSDYYKSTIATSVTAQFDDGKGNYTYLTLGTAAASSSTWKQYSMTFTVPAGIKNVTIFHLIAGVGTLQTDNFSLKTVDAPVVSVSAPVGVLSGTAQLTATASDALSTITSVQFQIDGVNVGTPIKSGPYTTSWDSTTVANGTHSLTATAINAAGVTTTSTPVTITVSNVVSNSNLITNPSVETPDPTNANVPLDWQTDGWGTNTATSTYLATGGHTGNRAVQTTISKYTSGDSKWYFNPVAVTSDTQYKFSDYYKATTATEVDVAFGMADGTTTYQIIGLPEPATTWTNFTTTFTVPEDAVNMTVYHLIHSVGTLTVDDENLQTYVPVGFNRALVTLTFDDGYTSEYTQGLPLLEKYGFTSTQFIITDLVNTSDYMTVAQLQALSAAGNEMASHTVTHTDMLTENSSQWTNELSASKTQLAQWIGQPVTDLAFPNGLYNAAIVAQTKQYYSASRGVEDGLNSKDNLNVYDIKVQNIYTSTTTAEVADWVAQAQATKTWLVLVYHSIDPVSTDIYNTVPAQLDSDLAAVKASGAPVVTMQQALAELEPQL